MLNALLKSLVDCDKMAVMICNLQHEIVYMNPAAVVQYAKAGGNALLGKSLMDCHNAQSNEKIRAVVAWFAADKDNNLVHTFYNEKQNKDVYMIALRNDAGELIGYYEKHESRNRDASPLYDMK